MGIQFSNRVENIAGKEEIARYEQFLLFPQCFQKVCVFVFEALNEYLWSKGLNRIFPTSDIQKWFLVGWLYWGFNGSFTAKVISRRSVTHMCFLAFLHQ